MSRRRKIEDYVVPTNVKFGLGISPFGGMIMAGPQNWFSLLVTVTKNETENGRKHRSREQNKLYKKPKSAVDIPQISNPEKKDIPQRRPKAYSLPPRFVETPKHRLRVPKIKIIKASEENIYDLCAESSDDDTEDCEDFVYECPGLAARDQDMTVENPLFTEKVFESSYRTPELPRKFWKHVFTETV